VSATNDTVPLDPEAEKKRKRREADAAKKAEAEVEAKIEDASVTAERAQLDLELLSIESAGYCLVDEPNLPESGSAETPEALVKTIEDAAAKARSAYAERWTVRSRDHAGWAARKILEAREHLDEVKRWAKTEVARADRQADRAARRFHVPAHDGRVTLAHRSRADRPVQRRKSGPFLADQHDSAAVQVQSVH